MPLYEYRCRTCDTRFEARRPMTHADAPARCPDGHEDALRLLSVFAATGRTSAGSGAPVPASVPAGGCGAACACAH